MIEFVWAVVACCLGCGVLRIVLDAQFRRLDDPEWLRELHSRHKLQQKLEKGMSPESREVLNRILWDKYREDSA